MTRPLLSLAAIGLVGYAIFFALFGSTSYTWHQRLTVIVDTPAGQVRGAAVTEVQVVQIVGVLTLAQGLHTYVSGEATVVEVLPGRFLFALLTSDDTRPMGDAGAWAYTAFDLTNRIAQESKSSFQVTKTLSDEPRDSPLPLPPQAMPLLVTFDDVSDTTTVRLVDPSNLSASFGPGVSLAGMTLEIT